jgi:hypothetical protein
MKRLLVIIIVLSFAVSGISAGLISFGFGAQGVNSQPISAESAFEDWTYGAEMRLGVLFLEGSLNGRFTSESEFTGLVTVGTNLSLFGLLHIGVGVGPELGLQFPEGEIGWFYRDDNGFKQPSNDILEMFNNGLVHYRAHADVKFGRFSWGLSYEVPSSGFTFSNEDYLSMVPHWDQAQFGTSLLFWLF